MKLICQELPILGTLNPIITRLLASYIPLTCVPQLLNDLILHYACVVIIKVACATNLWRPLFVLATHLIIKHMRLLIN
jgi:hypothetical protein